VVVEKPGTGAQGSGGHIQVETIEVRFALAEGVVVRAGDPVVVRAGIPLILVSAGREIGTFENSRVAAGIKAGFSYSGAVQSVGLASRRGVAQLQVS
jgi:hypothetical protein